MNIKIKYSTSFVAYLDVLGFKDMIKCGRTHEVEKYFTVLNDEISKLRKINKKNKIKFIIISDSVVLSMPKETSDQNENIIRLRNLCIAIGKIQQRLAIENIWLRGAISFGETYFDDKKSQIVGQAYIDAYLLEEDLAIYPRVIIDSRIIKDLGFYGAQQLIWSINAQTVLNMRSNWGYKVLFNWIENNGPAKDSVPQDIPLFIDYLYPLIKNGEYDKLLRVIENIRNNIYSDNKIYHCCPR